MGSWYDDNMRYNCSYKKIYMWNGKTVVEVPMYQYTDNTERRDALLKLEEEAKKKVIGSKSENNNVLKIGN